MAYPDARCDRDALHHHYHLWIANCHESVRYIVSGEAEEWRKKHELPQDTDLRNTPEWYRLRASRYVSAWLCCEIERLIDLGWYEDPHGVTHDGLGLTYLSWEDAVEGGH